MNRIRAFDADILIYAAVPDHLLGRHVLQLFKQADREHVPAGIGSVLLLPEVLTKPMRDGPDSDEVSMLAGLLGRLTLYPCDRTVAEFSLGMGSKYGLRAADAIHLSTAILAGAECFITNNRKDFRKEITEIDVVYPDELA